MTAALDVEAKLQDAVTRFVADPEGFVEFSYPWEQEGTALVDEEGPDDWQRQVMRDIKHGLEHGYIINNGREIDCTTGIRIAVKSGHGIGKTALMSWLDQWFISTHPHPQMRTTANTKEQLSSTTWREMAKWHKLLINNHWFRWTATKFQCLADPDTWFSNAVPQSEHNTQAFAGLHEKYVMVKFDEASNIPDGIWEVVEGAMTDIGGVRIWIVFGNPTQTTGRFIECWGKFRDMWVTYEVDSRTVKRTDKKLFQKWIDAYGEDSDFVRVRVKGQTPRAGLHQFIPTDIVEEAMGKIIYPSSYHTAPKILGVDISRFGDDQTVFIKRQGKAAYGLQKFRGKNTQTVAGLIAEEIRKWDPDQVFIDMGNTGAAVYDLLIGWGQHYSKIVTGVWFGSNADDESVYFNKRTEMWGRLRDWLPGAGIPDDRELRDDLVGPEYGFTPKEQFQLEKKEDIKKRRLASPDCGDALAVTFAYHVAPKARPHAATGGANASINDNEAKRFGYNTSKPTANRSPFYDR